MTRYPFDRRQRGHEMVFLAAALASAAVSTFAAFGQRRGHDQEALGPLHRYVTRELWDGDSLLALHLRLTGDEDLKVLGRFASLRDLVLVGPGVTDRALASIQASQTLTHLVVEQEWDPAKLTDTGLLHVRSHTSLKGLTYMGGHVTDVGFQHLERLRNLEALCVECREATDHGLRSLTSLVRLERLFLVNSRRMTGEGLSLLPAPNRLKALHLRNVSDRGMGALSRFTNLRDLSIGGDDVTAAGFAQLRSLISLEKLSVEDAGLDNHALEDSVRRLVSLRELRISGCPITGDAVKYLKDLTRLEVLSLSGPGIDDRSTPYVSELRNLRILDLTGTSVTEASWPYLLRLRTLETLSVPFSIRLTQERRKELVDALPRLKSLRSAEGEREFKGRMEKKAAGGTDSSGIGVPEFRTGWPRAVARPGLPQTRTCAINAFGSSSNTFASTTTNRRLEPVSRYPLALR